MGTSIGSGTVAGMLHDGQPMRTGSEVLLPVVSMARCELRWSPRSASRTPKRAVWRTSSTRSRARSAGWATRSTSTCPNIAGWSLPDQPRNSDYPSGRALATRPTSDCLTAQANGYRLRLVDYPSFLRPADLLHAGRRRLPGQRRSICPAGPDGAGGDGCREAAGRRRARARLGGRAGAVCCATVTGTNPLGRRRL